VHAVPAHEAGFAPGAEADKVQAARSRRDGVARQLQAKLIGKEGFDLLTHGLRFVSVGDAEDDEIIDIADVVLALHYSLDVLIQRIEIEHSLNLCQQVADGNTYAVVAINLGKQHEQVEHLLIFDDPACHLAQDDADNRVIEFTDVHLQRDGIRWRCTQETLRLIGSAVCAFIDPATVVVVNESALKDWIDDRVNRVLNHHIAECWRIDPARFAMLIDHERAVRPGSIGSGCQLVSQVLQFAAKIGLKAHH